VALQEDLRKLEEGASHQSGDDLAALREQLDTTLTHVTEHFRFEEENGYMDAVRKQEPRLERAIGQLAEEHPQLARSLKALVEQARAATSASDPLREEVRRWVERIRHHEARENALVHGAFNDDIGTKD
jgi:hypothetical protein